MYVQGSECMVQMVDLRVHCAAYSYHHVPTMLLSGSEKNSDS